MKPINHLNDHDHLVAITIRDSETPLTIAQLKKLLPMKRRDYTGKRLAKTLKKFLNTGLVSQTGGKYSTKETT